MVSSLVRVPAETRAKLRELATQTGDTMQQVLEKALEAYRRQQFLERANQAYARLRQDSAAWQEEQAERALWDVTLQDGVTERK